MHKQGWSYRGHNSDARRPRVPSFMSSRRVLHVFHEMVTIGEHQVRLKACGDAAYTDSTMQAPLRSKGRRHPLPLPSEGLRIPNTSNIGLSGPDFQRCPTRLYCKSIFRRVELDHGPKNPAQPIRENLQVLSCGMSLILRIVQGSGKKALLPMTLVCAACEFGRSWA